MLDQRVDEKGRARKYLFYASSIVRLQFDSGQGN